MTSLLNQPTYLAVPSSTTEQIPGNGKGSMLTLVDALDISAIVDPATVTVDAIVGLAVGQLAISTDGYWGTISDFPTNTNLGSFTTSSGSDLIAQTGTVLADGDTVYLSGVNGAGVPAPLVEGKVYFIVGTVAGVSNQLSLTSGGAAIDITGTNRTVGVRKITALNVRVDRWKNSGDRAQSSPATGTNVLNVFPTGSILAGARGVNICGLAILKAATASATLDFYDYNNGSALFTYTSAVGELASVDLHDWKLSTPFMVKQSSTANLQVGILFKITG